MPDLKQVMQKLNSQKSELPVPPLPPKKKMVAVKRPLPPIQEEEEEQETEEEAQEEEEDAPEEVEETPETSEEEKIDVSSEILKLHDNAVYRYEDLAVKHSILKELKALNYQIMKALGGEDGKK